ncbi:hypothetical protein RHGRI_025944 [Rhododendron griersonianum]|uniref:Uncharacterized protein n=1 Tax=Rhododendron griersonianum TaxID=479676 RepID=A0AAV6IX18_9ERIC|nr:hypothetical protein RHGRI_025944 [Rhododendron griersonianum]
MLLLYAKNWKREESFPISSGIGPESILLHRFKSVKLVKLPNCEGICPSNWLLFK